MYVLLLGQMVHTIRADGQDVKPAKEIMDDMIKEAKQCLERGNKVLSGGGARAKL
jgi:hypothetical protein